jgi:polyisoprenoid-binding protein YceI
MRYANLALTLSLMAVLTAGCGSGKPEDAKSAQMVEVQDVKHEQPAAAAPAAAPAEAAPAEAAPAPEAAAPAAPAVETKTYDLIADDDHYDCTVAFVGYKGALGSKEGGFSKLTGSLTVPGGDLTQLSVNITVDTTSLYSEADALTGVLREKEFLSVAEFPTAVFESSKVEKTDTGYLVTGNLTMRGITKGVQFPATIDETPQGIKTVAEFKIDRTQWGITSAGWKETLIDNEVLMKLDLLATPKAA